MSNKKVFITGATGFVGSHLTRFFVARKYEVHILSRKTSNYFRIQDVLKNVQIHKVSLNKTTALVDIFQKIKPAYIFHLANEGLYGGKNGDNKRVIETNLLGTMNLLEASIDIPCKLFINTGSSSEYGSKTHVIKEEDVCQPQSVYAISKLGSTLCAQSFAKQYNKSVVTLRIFSPYGPYDEKTRLIPSVIGAAIKNKPIHLASPAAVRDFIYVEDVARAYLSCIQTKNSLLGEVINIGSGVEQSVSGVVKKIVSITKSRSEVRWNSALPRPYESAVWQADISKAKRLLSWSPRYSMDEGLGKTIRFYREK